MERVILHCDMNNFYASVECMLDPSLREKPVAVCGSVEERHGIVLAKNYAAKAYGVSTGEAIWQAKQKCRDLVIVEPHYEQYMKFSKLAMITQQRVAKNVTIMPPDPALVQRDIRKKRLRVAPYCRVSTDSDEQLNSYEAQIEYYTAKIADNPEWTMVRMYADEGITGTSMKKRKEFLRLIADCKKGRVDLVITKSVTRFARNTLEGLQTVRQLKGLGIGVYFEKENVNTLYMDNEMILTFFFSQAQAESESLSGNVKWGHRKNFQDGKVYYHYDSFLGYRKGADGQPVVDEEQANVVRRIYSQYLMGYSVRKICTGLEGDGIRTARGTSEWHDSTVQGILRNEKYIGDAILQKTYVADLFNHQTKKNMGELPKYYVHDCHPAIIDRVTFQKVQEEIARRAGKRKTSSRAKTELGKYSGKYSLSEILICGECGSPYRRQTYMPKGENQGLSTDKRIATY